MTTHPVSDAPKVPTAAEALAEAWRIVQYPERCSDMNIRRAEVCLGIAREVREEQQYRATRSTIAAFGGVKVDHVHDSPPPADAEANLRKFAAQFRAGADPVMKEAAQRADVGQVVAAAVKMQTRINRMFSAPLGGLLWRVGDKADCRHCHTPIEYVEVRNGDRVEGNAWWHRYTQLAPCAVPFIADDNETTTFAEPE